MGTLMKTPLLLLVAFAFVSLTSGCALNEKYSKNSSDAQAWLQANNKRPAKTNFEGVYYSPDWGTVVLKQHDGKLTGGISYYKVKGIATGNSAFLVLVDDEWAGHTMILKRKNFETVCGSFSRHMPYVEQGSKPVRLDKIVN